MILLQQRTAKIIRSPLNYIGGKSKLLPQLLPLFPKEIDKFIDLFAGGCNVGINVSANKINFNDNLIFFD
jgi:DNA adenine methylase